MITSVGGVAAVVEAAAAAAVVVRATTELPGSGFGSCGCGPVFQKNKNMYK